MCGNPFALLLATIVVIFGGAIAAMPASVDKTSDLIRLAYDKGEFSGVVLIAANGKVTYKKAIGAANLQFAIPNQIATRFRICSLTKQFTAMLMMQLVEAGKVDLDSPISLYLPDFRKETGDKVKVRDLLTSSSGLPTLPDEFYVNEDAKWTDSPFVIGKYLHGDLSFDPGSKFNYNNGDFIILGEVIEKVSGKSYEQNLREKILEPLGMKNSGLLNNEDIVPNLASGYSYKNGKYYNESFVQVQNFGASGAMYSTAGDIFLWDKALMSNSLLSAKYTSIMFTASPKLGFVALGSWTYKVKLADGKEHRIVERQGYINGFCILNIIMPEDKLSAIFLSNTETQTLFQTYASRGLSYDVLNAHFGKKLSETRRKVKNNN